MATTASSPRARIVLRIVGAVLLVVGLYFGIRGGTGFIDAATSDSFEDDPGFGPILMIAAGLFAIVFGIGALNAGFLGAQSRYVAGETSDAVREFGSAFRGEENAAPSPKGGAFCSECGVQGNRGARFCDACGHALAAG